MDLHTLANIMKQEKEIHQSMLRLKKEEQNAIALGETDTIFKKAEQLNILADEAAALAHERHSITESIALELNLDSNHIRLKDILAELTPYNRTELETTRKELLDTVEELQRQNQANAQMLQRSMDALNQEVTQLVKHEESGVYNANGNRKATSPVRAGLNVQA